MTHTHQLKRLLPWLAGGVIGLAALLAWRTQYFVDVETTLRTGAEIAAQLSDVSIENLPMGGIVYFLVP